MRRLRLIKPPGIAETIEWAQAAKLLADEGAAWPLALRRSLGLLVKEAEDTETVLAHAEALGAVTRPGRLPRRLGGRSRSKRIDFLTALRDNPPPDITRLYWLARVTLVTRLEDIPLFDALFAHALPRRPDARAAPSEEGEERGAAAAKGGELQPVAARARAPARARASTTCATAAPTTPPPTTSPSCARRSPSTSRGSARAGGAPARRGHIDLRRTLRARHPHGRDHARSPAAAARTARARCWC